EPYHPYLPRLGGRSQGVVRLLGWDPRRRERRGAETLVLGRRPGGRRATPPAVVGDCGRQGLRPLSFRELRETVPKKDAKDGPEEDPRGPTPRQLRGCSVSHPFQCLLPGLR